MFRNRVIYQVQRLTVAILVTINLQNKAKGRAAARVAARSVGITADREPASVSVIVVAYRRCWLTTTGDFVFVSAC